MATASIPHRWKYDVFVSFRGDDIQQSFMDHMFNDFKQKGIHAFRDDRELPIGEVISPNLYKAIEESRFLIVIFSKNYASSSCCLRELVKILKCKQMGEPKHEVQIIFYDVKPNVVRNQTDSYAEAFAKHQASNRPEINNWKEALSMAANLSGWDLVDMANGFESKFIDSISREILKKLSDRPLHVGENLVGIDSHFDKLDLSRFVGSDKVNMIGICGISGIGKTTLAKAIYNLMHVHFEGSCFCEDVKEVTKRQGLVQVQLHMIRKIMKIDDLKISSVSEGIMVLKKIMSSKPILLVLDDVNNVEQLEALADSPDWFFPGSLIIFTGKDKQLLRSHKLDEIYEMETLEDYEALELFSLHAFGNREPFEDFKELASQVLIHLQGHPLALKVFGRLLYHKSVYVWKCELDRLRTYSNWGIQQIFRPSFDSLAYDQKRMFLDIACAFIGEKKDIAASVLDSSNCSANANIEVLVDKFLITVSPSNMSIQMRELIQSMAREIIREEFSMPGNHSRRLWISSEDDILNVNKVAEKVEVLVLLLKKNCQNIPIDGEALTRMKNLRILKICFPKVEGRWQPFAVNFSGRLDLLSNKLRLLYWHGLPLQSLPSDFYPENIVAIDLSYSHLKQLWTTPKCLRKLKVMKLSHCCNLTTTPDFSEITNLEELSLEGCVNLVSVHPSIDMLERLLVLNLRDCKRLQNSPSRVVTDCLRVLNLSDDIKITNWQRGELLGRGSFGSVYKGVCDGGYFIAVKEVSLLDSGESGRQSVVQLEQEIAMLSQFKHENIVRYYGTDKDESKLYLFLELMTKGSLLSLYQRNHLQDWQVSSYTQQILHGLKYLHDLSIVHRDVKCANILVDANGSVKLADFGLAKATKFNDVRSVKGTAFWMAPEVVNQKNGYGLAADIWSLGCTVLEMLTRRIPYSPMEWMPALLRIGRGIAPPVPDSLSKEARDFIFQCFHVNPRDRPTATQLLDHPFVR